MSSEQQETSRKYRILCVDDEPNILSALRRTLRPAGYKIFIAEGGAAGLEVMEREEIDLVISDMRMPEMDGAEFLSRVAQGWPKVMRILLTGYSDIDSTINAINKGKIYQYLSKPWEDQDLLMTIQRALENYTLADERDHLLEITRSQNDELKNLNSNLEAMVESRTQEVVQTASFLEMAYSELKTSYQDAVQVFCNLIELREGSNAGRSRRVAELARSMARVMELSAEQEESIYFGALLHDIGKMGLDDDLFKKPLDSLSDDERLAYQKYPVIGQHALMALSPLHEAANIVRAHCEYFDGSGFPDGLKAGDIPLGARILLVALDYDKLQQDMIRDGGFDAAEARKLLLHERGTRYDAKVLDVLFKVLDTQHNETGHEQELSLHSCDLKPGMVLSRDLAPRDGILLLTRGMKLADVVIQRLQRLEADEGWRLTVHVWAEPVPAAAHA